MFCQNCGAQNAVGTKFCSNCGASLQTGFQKTDVQHNAPVLPNYGMSVPPKSPKKNNNGLIIGIAVGAVALIAVVAVILIMLLAGNDKDKDKTSDINKPSVNQEEVQKPTDKFAEEHTNSTPSIEPTKPVKDFTADMTAEEFAQEVAELLFYGKYDEAKKYFLIKEFADCYPLEEGMDDLEYVLNRDACTERVDNGIKYKVLFEYYETESITVSENIGQLEWLYEEFGIEATKADIDYSKITEMYYVDINVSVVFDDNYRDSGDALICVVRYGDSWRCLFGGIDM